MALFNERLEPNGWRIDEQERAWVLRTRPCATWDELVPRDARGWLRDVWGALALLAVVAGCGAVSTGLDAAMDSLSISAYVAGYSAWDWAEAAWVAAVWFAFLLYCLPVTLIGRYISANKLQQQSFLHSGKFDRAFVTFDVAALKGLRLSEEKCLPGRRRLVFPGTSVKEIDLIGWPGLPADVAEAVRRAVIRRAGGVGQEMEEGANK